MKKTALLLSFGNDTMEAAEGVVGHFLGGILR